MRVLTFGEWSETAAAGVGMPCTVQDTEKLHRICGNAVADQKREAVKLQSPDATLSLRPALRGGHDRFHGGLGDGNEVMPQPDTLQLILIVAKVIA